MSGHPTREEDFDLYALAALEGEEQRAFAAHLAACNECARKLEAAHGRLAMLALAAPPHTPPDRVRERLLRQVREEQKRSGVRPAETRTAWWATIWVPAAALLAIATVFLWVSNNRLNTQLEQLKTLTQQQADQAKHARALLDLVTAGDTMEVHLAPLPTAAPAQGHVLYNARQGMVMYNGSLPPPPPEKTYQLWLVPVEGNPVSAGIFSPKPSGDGGFMMTPLSPGLTPKAFAVTLEPAGGRPQPTGPMLLAGPAS
jgi:anti-sigma-K factor RskA